MRGAAFSQNLLSGYVKLKPGNVSPDVPRERVRGREAPQDCEAAGVDRQNKSRDYAVQAEKRKMMS
jgi:hypothetical protein